MSGTNVVSLELLGAQREGKDTFERRGREDFAEVAEKDSQILVFFSASSA
jgi:hypothetical protein